MDIIPHERGDVRMKKVLASLSPLRKAGLKNRVLLAGAYLLIVAVLLVAIFWRNQSVRPLDIPPVNPVHNPAPAADPVFPIIPPDYPPDQNIEVIEGIEEEPPALAPPDYPMSWPVDGQILTEHHEVYRLGNQLRANVGVDIEAPAGTPVRAAWPGVVAFVNNDPRIGWMIEIRHGGGYITQYANLAESPELSVEDTVSAGDIIGTVGQSARIVRQAGEFLRFAVYRDGVAIDPVAVIEGR